LRAAALGVIFVVSGCGSGNSEYSEYFQIVKKSIANSFGDNSVVREQAAANPFASLGYRLDGGPELMLVLATDTNGQLLWTSSKHVVLLTQDGRVTRTTGLPHDLGALTPIREPALPAPATALDAPSLNNFAADFPDIGSYSVPLACRLSAKGRETIDIMGQPIRTIRVDEDCESANPSWRFRNSYWLDAESKFVWRSLQHIHPKGDTLQIEVFRPPG
jgi:hypothetical protein